MLIWDTSPKSNYGNFQCCGGFHHEGMFPINCTDLGSKTLAAQHCRQSQENVLVSIAWTSFGWAPFTMVAMLLVLVIEKRPKCLFMPSKLPMFFLIAAT